MEQLNAGIQEALLALLCYDPDGGKAVRAVVPLKNFDLYQRHLAEAADRYWHEYKKPPGEHTLDLINNLSDRNEEEKDIYQRLYQSLEATKEGINREYVLSVAGRFSRKQHLKSGITKLIETLQSEREDDVEEAERVIDEMRKASAQDFSPGLLLNDPVQALSFLDNQEDDVLPLGISLMDKYKLGPTRQAMWMMLALTNKGKTWGMIHVGRQGLIHGDRVLHITLEMNQKKIAQRYIQCLFSVSKRDDAVSRCVFEMDKLGRFISFSEKDMGKRPHLSDPKIRRHLIGRVGGLKHRPPLIIKQFPTHSLTLRELEGYLNALESYMKFIPDTIIIDYPDLMHTDSKNYRHSLNEIYVGLRGIAVERNVRMVVNSQVSKAMLNVRLINEGGVGEDWRKIQTADTVITYNQTDEELKLGLARLFAAKVRDESKHQAVLISQAYSVGQFCLDAVQMNDNYWSFVDGQDGEAEQEDEQEDE